MTKTKNDLIKEMQFIAEDINKKKEEIEVILKVLEELEKKYFELAEEIKNN
jgi:uncharacterized protein YoxC